MKFFKDKVVFITGASSGMGKALAVNLVKQGADVFATDVDEDGLEDLQALLSDTDKGVEIKLLDVTDKLAFEQCLLQVQDKYAKLDYIFNNAGIAIAGEVRDLTWEDWERTINIDQMGVLYGTLAAYEIMREQGFGHIVNTASIAGLIPTPLLAPYGMAKHAVVGLSTSLRAEAESFGVKVSVVCPGGVMTSIADGDFMRGADLPENPLDEDSFLNKFTFASSEEAAKSILKGVQKNQEKIVFPRHGRALVRLYKNTPIVMARMSRTFMKQYRERLRIG